MPGGKRAALLFAWVLLTDLNGGPVWVQSESAQVIRGKTDSCRTGVGSTIRVGSNAFCVREPPEQILELFRGKK